MLRSSQVERYAALLKLTGRDCMYRNSITPIWKPPLAQSRKKTGSKTR